MERENKNEGVDDGGMFFLYVDEKVKRPCLVKVGAKISATVYNYPDVSPEESLEILAQRLQNEGWRNIIFEKPGPEILNSLPNKFGSSLYLLP